MKGNGQKFSLRLGSGLLTPEHKKRMGSAIWLYLLLIDMVTIEDKENGKVFGGAPITFDKIKSRLGGSAKQYYRALDRLIKEKYIAVVRIPYGFVITVLRSKKFKRRDRTKVSKRVDKSVQSDRTDMSSLMDKSVHSNKDSTIDSIIDNTIDTFNQFWNLYQKKVGKEKCLKLWDKLKPEDHKQILEHVPKYVASTHDKQYRKDPKTYLYNRSWEDELITSRIGNTTIPRLNDRSQY